MKITIRCILTILLLLCCQVLVLARGKKEADTNTGKEGQATGIIEEGGERKFLITDFEDDSLYMRIYKGENTSLDIQISSEDKFEGEKSAKVEVNSVNFCGVEISVPEGLGDWETLRTVVMQVRGADTNKQIDVIFEDSQEEQFKFGFIDEGSGWKEVRLPIAAFKSRTDWQADTAVLNGEIDYPVKFFHFFSTGSAKFTIFVDYVFITDEGRPRDPNEAPEYIEMITPLYSLKEMASLYDLEIGAAISPLELSVERMTKVLPRDFSSVTATNEMKFYIIKAEQDTYNFTPADRLVTFAEDNGLLIRGHTLVWHNNMPKWLEEGEWTRAELLALLEDYIKTVVTRYKGKIYAWDVVNEVIRDNGQLRNEESVWFRVIGEEYIEKAFIWAHEADSDAKLFINDYNVAEWNTKSTATYELVAKLLKKGVPVHGFGAQLHLVEENPPRYKRIYENLTRFTELGLDVHFTEVDVRVQEPVTPEKLEHQAEIYSALINLALAFPQVTNFTTWGVSDAHSWIPGSFPGYNDALLFDVDFNPKPAYTMIQLDLLVGPQELEFSAPRVAAPPVPPFKAMKAKTVPRIDGKNSAGEWAGAIIYPFSYNQLDFNDLRGPARNDLKGSWRILYSGNTIYGAVERQDDITITDVGNSWDNDCLEIFYSMDDDFMVLRIVVGQDFESGNGINKAVWSAAGDFCEFSSELSPNGLDGNIIGWNIALADNDNGSFPEHQLFPLPGTSISWQGEELGEIEFVDVIEGARLGEAHLVPNFIARQAAAAPRVDGTVAAGEWTDGVVYPFSFNQLSSSNLTPPAETDLSGDWTVVYSGNTLYGLVRRVDDKTVTGRPNSGKNDAVEVSFELKGTFTQLRALVGSNFEGNTYTGPCKAAWSASGDLVEFSIVMPGRALEGQLSGWNIALSDNDGRTELDHKLYPINGTNASTPARELGGLQFE